MAAPNICDSPTLLLPREGVRSAVCVPRSLRSVGSPVEKGQLDSGLPGSRCFAVFLRCR
jgi:hypothetical protein